MKIRLLLDEDVQVGLAAALKTKGVDATSVQELERRGLSDIEQLKFASADVWVFFTYNVGDFVKLHEQFIKQGKEHRGIIVSKQLSISEALERLCNLAKALTAGEMVNRLEFLTSWK